MQQCLNKYEWVKLLRAHLPEGKGIMAYWAKLASHAAFRKGKALYCGCLNAVTHGMWSGGVVGLKSILGVKSRKAAVVIMDALAKLGYIVYNIDSQTKHLVYQVTDHIVKCAGKECMNGTVYAIDGYGFLCLPRTITERLVKAHVHFEDADAWLDLWCHTVFRDPSNAFSQFAPTVQYGSFGAVLTLEALGRRWGWERTKVWRFFKKHGDVFSLYRLPGNYGFVLYNQIYPTGKESHLPTQEEVSALFYSLCDSAERRDGETTTKYLNRLVAWFSKRVLSHKRGEWGTTRKNRVALSAPIIRAYLSLCRNCKNCGYDCKGIYKDRHVIDHNHIRGPNRLQKE